MLALSSVCKSYINKEYLFIFFHFSNESEKTCWRISPLVFIDLLHKKVVTKWRRVRTHDVKGHGVLGKDYAVSLVGKVHNRKAETVVICSDYTDKIQKCRKSKWNNGKKPLALKPRDIWSYCIKLIAIMANKAIAHTISSAVSTWSLKERKYWSKSYEPLFEKYFHYPR